MKKLINLRCSSCDRGLGRAIGCASTTDNHHRAPPQKEVMLQQAGFKTHTVTTARQKEASASAA